MPYQDKQIVWATALAREAGHLIVYREDCSVQNPQLLEVLFSHFVERDLEIRHRHRRRATYESYAESLGIYT